MPQKRHVVSLDCDGEAVHLIRPPRPGMASRRTVCGEPMDEPRVCHEIAYRRLEGLRLACEVCQREALRLIRRPPQRERGFWDGPQA
jgi:hypothetical protein